MKIYHIMPINSFFYNASFISLINDHPNEFNRNEHYFVVVNEEDYNAFKGTNHMIYDPDINNDFRSYKKIKKYVDESDYTILHSYCFRWFDLMRFTKKRLKKMVWSEWGHDLYRGQIYKGMSVPRKILNFCISQYRKIEAIKVNQFYSIAVGFEYDIIEAKKRWPKLKVLPILYGYTKGKLELIDKTFTKKAKKKNAPVKILIGHNGFKFNNHIEILNKLKKYKNENIIISLPLNYGEDDNYTQEVIKEAKRIFKDKVEILDKTMPYEQYLKYINTLDICILDFKHQAALGNLFLFLKKGCKIYLNDDGLLKLALVIEQIPVGNTSDIGYLSFKEFIKPFDSYSRADEFANLYLDDRNHVNKLKATIDDLRMSYKKAKK